NAFSPRSSSSVPISSRSCATCCESIVVAPFFPMCQTPKRHYEQDRRSKRPTSYQANGLCPFRLLLCEPHLLCMISDRPVTACVPALAGTRHQIDLGKRGSSEWISARRRTINLTGHPCASCLSCSSS